MEYPDGAASRAGRPTSQIQEELEKLAVMQAAKRRWEAVDEDQIGQGKGVRNPNREQTIEQAVQVFELRLAGASISQIARQLHLSTATIGKRLRQHERAYLLPLAESVRKMEIARYDAWLLRLQPGIQKGDVGSINTALKISEARRRLLGVDAPVEVNNRYPDGVPNPQLDSNISKLLDDMEQRETA